MSDQMMAHVGQLLLMNNVGLERGVQDLIFIIFFQLLEMNNVGLQGEEFKICFYHFFTITIDEQC